MSELRFSSKKDAVLNIKSFCETLFNAKNHLNYSNQKSDVEKYLKLLDIYSKKIDLDLNNSIMSLRLAIAQNYGNAQCFDIEGMKWIDKWYTNFKNQTEYSIALLPNSQDYQPILDSFGASMEKFNQRVEELEKKYEGLEKKISQPQQIPQKQATPQQPNIPQQIPQKQAIPQQIPQKQSIPQTQQLEDIIMQRQKYQNIYPKNKKKEINIGLSLLKIIGIEMGAYYSVNYFYHINNINPPELHLFNFICLFIPSTVLYISLKGFYSIIKSIQNNSIIGGNTI